MGFSIPCFFFIHKFERSFCVNQSNIVDDRLVIILFCTGEFRNSATEFQLITGAYGRETTRSFNISIIFAPPAALDDGSIPEEFLSVISINQRLQITSCKDDMSKVARKECMRKAFPFYFLDYEKSSVIFQRIRVNLPAVRLSDSSR